MSIILYGVWLISLAVLLAIALVVAAKAPEDEDKE